MGIYDVELAPVDLYDVDLDVTADAWLVRWRLARHRGRRGALVLHGALVAGETPAADLVVEAIERHRDLEAEPVAS